MAARITYADCRTMSEETLHDLYRVERSPAMRAMFAGALLEIYEEREALREQASRADAQDIADGGKP